MMGASKKKIKTSSEAVLAEVRKIFSDAVKKYSKMAKKYTGRRLEKIRNSENAEAEIVLAIMEIPSSVYIWRDAITRAGRIDLGHERPVLDESVSIRNWAKESLQKIADEACNSFLAEEKHAVVRAHSFSDVFVGLSTGKKQKIIDETWDMAQRFARGDVRSVMSCFERMLDFADSVIEIGSKGKGVERGN